MIPPYQGFRPRKPFLLYAVFGLEINFKLPLSQCRFHAFRYSLFPQQPAAQPVIIYGKIFSVLPLDAAGSQKSPVAHLVHRNSAVLNGINAPFHQHIFALGRALTRAVASMNISSVYLHLRSISMANWSPLKWPHIPLSPTWDW